MHPSKTTIFIILLSLVTLLACTNSTHNSCGDISDDAFNNSSKQEYDFNDTTEFKRFRKFDFFTLQGYDTTIDTPFVAVKSDTNMVIAKVSTDVVPYIFERQGKYWHTRRGYNFDTDWDADDLSLLNPKIIDFFTCTDTVYEFVQNFGGERYGHLLIVNTRHSEYKLPLGNSANAIPFYDDLLKDVMSMASRKYGSDFRDSINNVGWTTDKNIHVNNRRIKNDSIIYPSGYIDVEPDKPIILFNDDHCKTTSY